MRADFQFPQRLPSFQQVSAESVSALCLFVALFPYKHLPLPCPSPMNNCLPVWVSSGTTASAIGEEDQDVRQQMFRMHCTALQFRRSGNNRVSEQELAKLCEIEWVSGT